MIRQAFALMAVAAVEIGRIGARCVQVREYLVAIHCDADLRAMLSRNRTEGCRWLLQAVGYSMIVIADMEVYVAAAIIKRSDGMGGEDRVERRWTIQPDAVVGEAGSGNIRRL